MRNFLYLSMVATLFAALGNAQENQFVELASAVQEGKLHVSAKNILGRPIVALVVAVDYQDDGRTSATHQSVYTGRDSWMPDQVETIVFNGPLNQKQPTVFVDYVRASDGARSGNTITDTGKKVADRFRN